jgi:hypothetical protein
MAFFADEGGFIPGSRLHKTDRLAWEKGCAKPPGEKIIENKINVFRYQDMKEEPGKIYDNSSLP